VTHGYRESFDAAGYEVTFYDAGHVPGSAHVLVSEGRGPSGNRTQSDDDDGETRLRYTGDFHTVGQRLVSPTAERPDAAVVVTESTYVDVERDPREAVEERFVDSVRTTLWEGGTVVPGFTIGRTQAMLCVCEAHDVDCYVDGMGQEVTRLVCRHPEFPRDAEAMRRVKSNARFVTGRDGHRGSDAPTSHTGRPASRGQRERIADRSAVIITTAGMLGNEDSLASRPPRSVLTV
jgi:putative mRNA 3-end processing factor